MITQEDIFKCAGWQAINRMGQIASINHIFSQNYSDLNNLLLKIYYTVEPTEEIYQEIHQRLEQYIFNFLAASFALTDNCRKVMAFYKETDLYKKYQQKVDNEFAKDTLANFIRQLRNYQTHYKLEFPTPVRSLDDNTHWDVVFISDELLKHPNEWNSLSKQYITQCGKEINIGKMSADYNHKIDMFYHWLYGELKAYHKEDFAERDKLFEEIGWKLPGLSI